RTSCAKRWIGEDDVKAFGRRHLIDRVAEADVWLNLVEVQIHQSKAPRPRNQFLSKVGASANPFSNVSIKRSACLVQEPLICDDQESPRATRRVADLEVPAFPRIRLDASNDRLN